MQEELAATWGDSSERSDRQLVRVLRAADIFWSQEQRPVLCLLKGEHVDPGSEGARIYARQQHE